jgi:hypothetical protein
MAKSPKDTEEKLERMLNGWRTLAPDKSFGGMTLAQFEAAIAPSLNARQRIKDLENQLEEAKADRDSADVTSNEKANLAFNGVLADPTEGPDSPLITTFGYTRRSERRTGLTRKSNKQPTQ